MTIDPDAPRVVFPLSPEWSGGVKETWEFLTGILVAEDGSEQRVRLRRAPRVVLSFPVLAMDAMESGFLDALMYRRAAKAWDVPVWTDAVGITSVASGSSPVVCDTANRAFRAGGRVLLWRAWNAWEVASIGVVSGAGFTLSAPLASTWPAGTLAVPLRQGILMSDGSGTRPAPGVSSMPVSFRLTEA
jgi:hypothetical protein